MLGVLIGAGSNSHPPLSCFGLVAAVKYMYSLDKLLKVLVPGHLEKSNLPIRTFLVSKTKDSDLFLTKNKSKTLVNINNTFSAMAKLETRQKFEVF